MFFQPAGVFPGLAAYRPLRTVAFIALIFYALSEKETDRKFLEADETKYYFGFVIMQIISAAVFWLSHGYYILNDWLKTSIIYFLIIKLGNSIQRIEHILLMIVSGITYLSVYSITNYFKEHNAGNVEALARGFGWFDGTNDIAMILVSMVPFLFYFITTCENKLKKIIFMCILVMFSYNIMITGSRGGILGFIVTSSLCVIFSRLISTPQKIIAIVLVIAFAIPVGIEIIQQRSDIVAGSYSQDDSAQNRIIQWKAGARMVLSHPLLGVGPEKFSDFSEDYGGIRNLAPHNTIVQVIAETGIIGGLFFILMNFFALKDAYIFIKDETIQARYEGELLLYRYLSYSLIGFWVCAFFSNRNQSYILYVTIAIMIATKFLFFEESEES